MSLRRLKTKMVAPKPAKAKLEDPPIKEEVEDDEEEESEPPKAKKKKKRKRGKERAEDMEKVMIQMLWMKGMAKGLTQGLEVGQVQRQWLWKQQLEPVEG